MRIPIVLIMMIICESHQEKTKEKWNKLKGTIESKCTYLPIKGEPKTPDQQLFLNNKKLWIEKDIKEQELEKLIIGQKEQLPAPQKSYRLVYMSVDKKKDKEEIKISRLVLNEFSIEDLYTMRETLSGILEVKFLSCEYDDKHIYISKTMLRLEQICKKLEKETPKQDNSNNQSKPINEDLRTRFQNLVQKDEGKGGFGEVRKYSFEQDGVASPRAIKRVTKNGFKIKEVYILKLMSKNKYGVKFYGCEFDEDHVYIEQEGLVKNLEDPEFIEEFSSWNQEKQIDLFIEMVEAVREFLNKNFAHCDLKLENVMLDEKKQLKLIDFGNSVPVLGRNSEAFTPHYIHPLSNYYHEILPFFDLFSIAQMIVALMNKSGADVFGFVWNDKQTTEKVDESCGSYEPDDDCLENYKRIILGSVQEKWGDYDDSKEYLILKNLTELLVEIVFDLNKEMDLDDFLMHLQRIKKNKFWIVGKKIKTSQNGKNLGVETNIEKSKNKTKDVKNYSINKASKKNQLKTEKPKSQGNKTMGLNQKQNQNSKKICI